MKHENCDKCGIPLYYEDATHNQDDAYEIDDLILCEDCITEYVKKNYFKKLKEDNP